LVLPSSSPSSPLSSQSARTLPHLVFTPDSDEDDHDRKDESNDYDRPRTTLLVAPPTALISSEGVVVKDKLSPRRRTTNNKMMSVAINAADEHHDERSLTSSASAALLEEEEHHHHNQEELHPHERRAECYKLCTYDEAPPYLQHNPFIRTGYRSNFSFKLCLHSFYRLHNGTQLNPPQPTFKISISQSHFKILFYYLLTHLLYLK
jgi:hypothetical protein